MTEAACTFRVLNLVFAPAEYHRSRLKVAVKLVTVGACNVVIVLNVGYENFLLYGKVTKTACQGIKVNKAVLAENVLVLVIKITLVCEIEHGCA